MRCVLVGGPRDGYEFDVPEPLLPRICVTRGTEPYGFLSSAHEVTAKQISEKMALPTLAFYSLRTVESTRRTCYYKYDG